MNKLNAIAAATVLASLTAAAANAGPVAANQMQAATTRANTARSWVRD